MNYDEKVNFAQGGDDGQNDADSVQPIGSGEFLWHIVLDRPLENLRKRTEVLKSAVETLNYEADYDRALLLRSDAQFTLTNSSGNYTLASTGDLWLYPAATPGRLSGGRNKGGRVFVNGVPYSGTALVNDLILTASSQYTGQRGYQDGTSLDGSGSTILTVGANNIVVNLVADATLSTGACTASFDGVPKSIITIKYGTNGGVTQLGSLITFINNDTTSQGTYGVAHFLRASTTGSLSNTPTAFTGGVVQGAYDAEAHQVTAAQLAAFFTVSDNRLQEGEALCLGYPAGPVEKNVPLPKGGRRQSVWDLPVDRSGGSVQNTTPSLSYMLFNTGREPEKIPGCVPIGKLLDGKFVFVDGTVLIVGQALTLTESSAILLRLSANTISSTMGSDLIGYAAVSPTVWNADASDGISATTVRAALDEIVTDLAAQATSNSGSRRIGAEAIAGTSSASNAALALAAGSVRTQISAALNQAGAAGAPGGINSRVSEYGHRMHGALPLSKDFSELGSGVGGGQFISARLHTPDNGTGSRTPVAEQAIIVTQPFSTADLHLAEPVLLVGTSYLRFSAGDISSRWANIWPLLPAFGFSSMPASPILLELSGVVQGSAVDGNGIYTFVGATSESPTPTFLVNKLGGGAANFTGANFTSATVTFLTSHIVGGSTFSNTRQSTYHHYRSEANRIVAVGASTDAVERVYHAGATALDASAVLGAEYGGNFAKWKPDSSAPRHTDNILITADAATLKGIETGTPVDATASHHHGSKLTGIKFLADSDVVTLYTDTYQNLSDVTDLAVALPHAAPYYTGDANSRMVGVLVRVRYAGVGVIAGRYKASMRFTKNGTETNPAAIIVVDGYTNVSTDPDLDYETQVIVPTNAGTDTVAPRFYIRRISGAGNQYNYDATTSTLTIKIVGIIVSYV